MTFQEITILILAVIGTIFMFVSAVGIVRLPDVYARMHAAGKSSTLGIICLFLAAGIYFGGDILVRMLVLIALFLLTVPVAATAMARAAYRADSERDYILNYDDLADHYRHQPDGADLIVPSDE
jgi:multicomponent Na+:H+ antiporter subunit G